MIRSIFVLALTTTLLSACGGFPYRIDVDQGNLIDQQSLSHLNVGMSKNEVQRLLGTTLLQDIFHRNRWDYVQYYKQGSTQSIQKSKVSLFFTNDKLSRIESDEYKAIKTEPVPYSLNAQ